MMKRRRFIVYLIVGLSAYLIEMGSLYVLKVIMGLSDVASVAMSFWIGFIVAFILQKWVTFKSHDKKAKTVGKQLILYGVLAAFNYVVTLGIVAVFSAVASVFVVRTIAIACITIWNYALYRTVIFKAPPSAKVNDGHSN